MKPCYIKMSAFGSYAGVETVNFSDEGIDHGIFLITGDTGAGKTTIFDAITYALYDRTSGAKRDGEMMRSQFANEEISTFVELEFIYKGSIYRIKRMPKQERISKVKKNGEYKFTTDAASVELTMPDGRIFPGKKTETDNKIVEIMGLTFEQFTQIAMIAQGDFLKLLHAPSKERKLIFERIFNTGIYSRIEKNLLELSVESDKRLLDNRKNIERETGDIRCIEGSIYAGEWQEAPAFLESEPEKLIALINNIKEEAKLRATELEAAIGINLGKLNEKNTKISQAEEINKLFYSLEAAREKEEILKREEENISLIEAEVKNAEKASQVLPKENMAESKKSELSACQGRIRELELWLNNNKSVLEILKNDMEEAEKICRAQNPNLSENAVRIKEMLPKFEYIEKKKNEKAELDGNALLKATRLAELEEAYKTSKQKMENLTGKRQELENCYSRLPIIQAEIQKIKDRKTGLEALAGFLKERKNHLLKYNEAEKFYKEAENNSLNFKRKYEEAFQSFIKGQAGIIASALTEGNPCPVCGSISHPLKAESSSLDVGETELQIIKEENEKAEAHLKEMTELMQKAENRFSSSSDIAQHEGKKVIGEAFDIDNISDTDLTQMIENCKTELEKHLELEKKALDAKEISEANEIEIKKIDERLAENLVQNDKEQKELQDIKIIQAGIEAEIKSMKDGLIFDSYDVAQAELDKILSKIEDNEKKLRQATLEYNKSADEKNIKAGSLTSEKKQEERITKDKTLADAEFAVALKNMGFEDQDAYRRALCEPERLSKKRQDIQKHKDVLTENITMIKMLTEQTFDKHLMDTEVLELERKELELERDMIENQRRAVCGIYDTNREKYEKVKGFYEAREKEIEENNIISRLSKTANGKLSNKHLNFQTYIQRRYFNLILNEANRRLLKMSNNQFILKCRDISDISGNAEAGLELDVYSLVNNMTRDVKTLSGGESFMAALAMALGMSDIIQNTAGSICIETMFIDEGFGSLSEDTRMQAIAILAELSGEKRLVGIISHVTELKSQIETKLVVTKTKSGSTVKWEKA